MAAARRENRFSSDSDSSEFGSGADEDAWIQWFCNLKGNEFFCEVDEEYIQDSFNLTGLNTLVSYYEYALDMILDVESTEDIAEDVQETIEQNAEKLYGLIHARFILTSKGLHLMAEKLRQSHFGHCPVYYCDNQGLIPVGLHDHPNKEPVKLWCPKCENLFQAKPRHAAIDGAYFGTTFPHLFFLVYPELKPEKLLNPYVPRVWGFKIHASAHEKSLEAAKKRSKQKREEEGKAPEGGDAVEERKERGEQDGD